jgi:hypothetical protein
MTNDKITMEFTREQLGCLYLIAQTGLLSQEMNILIKDVVLHDDEKRSDYKVIYSDYRDVWSDLREMSSVYKGKDTDLFTDIYAKLDEIAQVYNGYNGHKPEVN